MRVISTGYGPQADYHSYQSFSFPLTQTLLCYLYPSAVMTAAIGQTMSLESKGPWEQRVSGFTSKEKQLCQTHINLSINNVPTLSDGKTKATKEQIETREVWIIDYEKHECLAQHVILSTTSTRIGAVIKNLNTAHEMWEKVKTEATTKSTLYLIDAEDQLANMRVGDSDDS